MDNRWYAYRDRIFVPYTFRRRVYDLGVTSVKMLRREGVKPFITRLGLWIQGERRYYQVSSRAAPASANPTLPPPAAPPPSPSPSSPGITEILQHRFPNLLPLPVYPYAFSERRLNLVTDSIGSGSLFGGVATGLILGALLAKQWNCPLRIITRHDKASSRNFGLVLQANGISFTENVEFIHAPLTTDLQTVPIGTGDYFLTTSWWTTESVRRVVSSRRILYLLQEDERTFYPFGDDMLRCTDIFSDPALTFIINTRLLYDHLAAQGFSAIAQNGLVFEPSWPEALFRYTDNRSAFEQRRFFFYARPNHVRNLYYLGLETVEAAVTRGILPPDKWQLHFVGKNVPDIRFGPTAQVFRHEGLSWANYAALVRTMDLGLSLMYSPHPSYPPIDLAASGAVVVTNRYGVKQSLDQYSQNILCRDLQVEDLLAGLEAGIKLVDDQPRRLKQYGENRLLRDWHESFQPVLTALSASVTTTERR